MARPNKRQRQAIRKARLAATECNAQRASVAEAIPCGRGLRSNPTSWDRAPAFRGVGWNAKGAFARGESSRSSGGDMGPLKPLKDRHPEWAKERANRT